MSEKYLVPDHVIHRVMRLRKRHLGAIERARNAAPGAVADVKRLFEDACCILREHGYTRSQAEMTFTAIKKVK